MGVSAALAFVLGGVPIAQHPSTSAQSRRGWMWVAWAAMAVAVLTKGLIGIVRPSLAMIVYTLVARDFGVWRRLHLVSGLLILLAIATPWFVLASKRNPEFLNFFFIHEHFQRYLSTVHPRQGGWWHLMPIALVGFLPWLPLSQAMVSAARTEHRGVGFQPMLLLVVWAASIFVFLSASSSKLPGVLLACALLAMPIVARLGNPTIPNALFRAFHGARTRAKPRAASYAPI